MIGWPGWPPACWRSRIALVPLIEDDRQFFKACVGLPEPWASARQTPLSHSLCQHVMVARQPLAIGDTGRDALARDNPLVRELGLAAYLGVPLIDASGYALGSLCVADHRPREWTPIRWPSSPTWLG